MYLVNALMTYLRSLKVCWNPLVSVVTTLTIGGAYTRHLDADKHQVGKRNIQKIERKNLNFRTWIKRLTRKTICFSKLEVMHDTVIGLLINKVEFGRNIYT